MAVSVDNPETALRLGDTAEERALATRLLKTAKIVVEKHAPRAPTAIKDEACIRLCGLLVRPCRMHRAGLDTLTRSGTQGRNLCYLRIAR